MSSFNNANYKQMSVDSYNERATTVDSKSITSIFDFEGSITNVKAENNLEEPMLRESEFYDTDDEDGSRRVDFSANSSFLTPEQAVITNASMPASRGNLAFKNKTNFAIGCLMLLLMVVPCSIIGPMTISLPAKNVYVQATWRYQGCTFLAVPLMLGLYHYKGSAMDIRRDFAPSKLLRSAVNSFFIYLWNLGFILGCSLTLTAHADIMYSSGGVYLIMIAVVTCKSVHQLEYAGYVLYALGVYLMFTDVQATKTGMNGQSYVGDLYAFLGAGCSAVFNLINIGRMEDQHPLVTLTQNFIFATIFQLVTFPFFMEPSLFFSFDPVVGAFGWMTNFNAFVLLMGVVAPVTGILGNLGFYTAYYYFPMEIVAGTMLTEPFFAQTIGILLGQDEIPGLKTVFGCTVITIGFLIAGVGQKYRTEPKDEILLKIEEIGAEEYDDSSYERID